MVSGSTDKKKEWRDQNRSGSYSYVIMKNDRKVYKVYNKVVTKKFLIFLFQSDKRNEYGDYYYVWYNHIKRRWQFLCGEDFEIMENVSCVMWIQSTGKTRIRLIFLY